MQGWRCRSNRGHCRASSFSFCLLLGYYALLFSIMGCSLLHFLDTVAPPWAPWLSTVHLTLLLTYYSSSWILLQRNTSRCMAFLAAVGLNLRSLKVQGVDCIPIGQCCGQHNVRQTKPEGITWKNMTRQPAAMCYWLIILQTHAVVQYLYDMEQDERCNVSDLHAELNNWPFDEGTVS